MKTAAAYVRVSTEKQDEYSLDSQLKLIQEYAKARDIIVPKEYVFVEDGISGRRADKRPAFQRMIGHAKAGDFDLILVWKYSRFARNQEESILYKSMLSRSGVDVVSISETLDDSPFASLIERIIEWMDEFYSIRLSGEVKRGMLEKISRGESAGKPPFGYSTDGKKFVPDQNAKHVQRIFTDYASGVGMRTLADSLNAEGLRSSRGRPFSNRQIKYILSNPTYVGKLRWSTDGKNDYTLGKTGGKNAFITDGQHVPLIDMETWDIVQQKLERNAQARPYTRHEQTAAWMLKGLVRCSACGSTLVAMSAKSPAMQCHRYSRGECKVSHALSLKKANAALIAALESCVESGVFPLAPQVGKAISPGKDFAKLIAAEELKLRRVLAAYEAGVDTLEEYAEKKKKLQAGIDALKAEQANEITKAPVLPVADMQQKVVSVLELIKSEDVSEEAKNKALRSILSHVVYEKEQGRLALHFSFS